NYAFSYTILPPVFGPDPEPNDGGSQATPVAYDTYQEGRANFDGESTYDYFSITTPANGVFNIEIQAEHGGAQPGTMDVQLSFSGVNVQSWTVPIGSLSVPVASTVSIPCRSVGADYRVRISSSVCGASYRWKYTITPPLFANDLEPNNTLPTAIVLPQSTPAEGQLNFIVFNNPENTDFYRIDLPVAGTISVTVEAEHVGASTIETIITSIVTSAGSTLATFNGAIGANSTPASSTFGLPCLSSTSPYYIKLEGGICGVSYRVSWTMTPPVFATDPEPNNGGSQATPVNYNTFQEGQIGFLGDNADYYEITPTLQGVMRIEVQAEHGGDTPGTMDVALLYSGVTIIVETIPVGANGQPITTIVSVPCRGSSTHNVLFDAASGCGTSYRWRYYTTDPNFPNDTEPNNTVATSILLPEDTYATGQLNFHNGVDGTGADNTDVHRMDLPADGVLNVTIEAEHTGASETETIQVQVRINNGVTLATWDGSIGANSSPALSTFSLPCRGASIPYYLWLSGGTCGVSYRVSWNVTPAYFANDAEPNNSAATAIPLDLSTNWYDGHIGFYNTTDDDLYFFSHSGGPWSAAVSAEHADAGEGSLTMVVRTLSGVVVSTFPVPVGGSSTPLTNTFTIPTLNAASYRIFMSDVTCGVSYRIHCAVDADNDGVCDAVDLCSGGPEPGTPCDDGNAGTVDDVITADCICEGDITTGISGTDAPTADLRIWPNPATDEVWMDIGEGATGTATVIVRDLLGRTIAVLGPIAANAPGQYLVQLGTMAQGTYIIELRVGSRQWSRRIVKA
nr:T9SS type A sorting domain-containing protein [Flavobacteriales bacterium]